MRARLVAVFSLRYSRYVLTLFSIPKPFVGHIGIIQRNAIRSWTLLHPDVEIILCGDDPGTAEVAREFGVGHEPDVERNSFGSALVNAMFSKAQARARYDLVCYVNCDIILMHDFREALERVRAAHQQFLMVGQRWDLDIKTSLDFADAGWESRLRNRAIRQGKKRPANWIDYFAFFRGLYGADVPPFAIGRTSWDNWLVWKALDSGTPVVDASPVVVAVHQNHDYNHLPGGEKGAFFGEEAQRNHELLAEERRLCTVEQANYRLGAGGLQKNLRRVLVRPRRQLRGALYSAWFFFLDLSRPVRHRLGWRQKRGVAA